MGAPLNMGNWQALFDFSMKFHDGTHPTDWSKAELTPERREWLAKALSSYMQDFGKRMQAIKKDLDGEASEETPLEHKEALLEELLDIVEQIDFAKDLHTIGGLETLLSLLQSPEPSLRWRAAEVVGTCCQNYADLQAEFLKADVLGAVLPLLGDTDAKVLPKAVFALGCMVRGHGPTLEAFRSQGGLAKLMGLLSSEDDRLKARVLRLISHVLKNAPEDAPSACEDAAMAKYVAAISSEDMNVRESALLVLKELCDIAPSLAACRANAALGPALDESYKRLSALAREDWDAVEEEAVLCKQVKDAVASGTATRTGAPADRMKSLALGNPL